MAQRDLVLLGGGHTHALLMRRLAMKPLPGVRVTLVSETPLTAYSGMLPGLVAGHYDVRDTHIDLDRLSRRTGVRFIVDRAEGLDLAERRLLLTKQPALPFDAVSVDTGSTPNLDIPGASDHAIGVKPVSRFYTAWERCLSDLEASDAVQHWGVVGAGAGGVELVLAMAWRLRHRSDRVRLHLFFRQNQPLQGSRRAVVRQAMKALRRHGVECHPNFPVAAVTGAGVTSDDGHTVPLDQTFLCTPAQAPGWPEQAGLETANGGFIAVNEYLQSTSHPCVFAAGDVAEMTGSPRPKAGVYAVRQAPFLHHNLGRYFAGEPLEPLQLQDDFLSLLSLGDRRATGGRSGITVSGRWVWRWKDRIDRRFMQALNESTPPPMTSSMAGQDTDDMAMHCAGCGSKLSPEVLRATLNRTQTVALAQLEPALGRAEDASVFTPTPGMRQVQSLDGFRSFTDDLYTFGRIGVLHALSDLYAMNAVPRYAQLAANMAFGHPKLQQRDFARLMAGIESALNDEAVALAGGHSTEGAETHLTVSVTGEVVPEQAWRKSGAQPGDWLVLTKPLGTGVILAAQAAGETSGAHVADAIESMLVSNREASARLAEQGPNAVTDVTGFGLLGHLLELLTASNRQAEIELDAVPALSGALDLLRGGRHSTLYPQLAYLRLQCRTSHPINEARMRLLLDPQTSGGLLAAVPGSVNQRDLPGTVIGRIVDDGNPGQPVRLL